MMFSTQWSVNELAKRQFLFKLNGNGSIFSVLIVLQIIGTVLMGGSATSTSTSTYTEETNILSFNFSAISNDGQVGLTLFWAFIIGFVLTSPAQRNESFTFVTNRLTFQLANFYFFCTAALFGGVTTVLLGSVMKIFAMFNVNTVMQTNGLLSSPLDFFSQIFVMTAYTLLLMLVGYTLGSFIQFSKLFIMLFALVYIVFTQTTFFTIGGKNIDLLHFFYGETSILLFTLKILLAVAVLFGASFWVTNRLEVRNP
ncbi:hypothetical protein ORD22_13135 [Sporosarcina sp. GW1-11]|uniref:hypothetical protein n=1 Tax=Sporosarcina sp. GW1-11 TaxID=2899126 RepID=UPI00294E948E|nr:hypothetical protein [Sporosarcina sp. GW1-11]MDV6379159.1 hypothetical protein [Sporosarcina sp. GW1-11]